MHQCGSKHPRQSSCFSGCSLHNTTKIPKHLCHKHSLVDRLLHMGRSLGGIHIWHKLVKIVYKIEKSWLTPCTFVYKHSCAVWALHRKSQKFTCDKLFNAFVITMKISTRTIVCDVATVCHASQTLSETDWVRRYVPEPLLRVWKGNTLPRFHWTQQDCWLWNLNVCWILKMNCDSYIL